MLSHQNGRAVCHSRDKAVICPLNESRAEATQFHWCAITISISAFQRIWNQPNQPQTEGTMTLTMWSWNQLGRNSKPLNFLTHPLKIVPIKSAAYSRLNALEIAEIHSEMNDIWCRQTTGSVVFLCFFFTSTVINCANSCKIFWKSLILIRVLVWCCGSSACEIFQWAFARPSTHSLASSPMSILVNSVRTLWVEISATNSWTVLSSWLLSVPPSEAFTFTTGGPHGSFTVVLP